MGEEGEEVECKGRREVGRRSREAEEGRSREVEEGRSRSAESQPMDARERRLMARSKVGADKERETQGRGKNRQQAVEEKEAKGVLTRSNSSKREVLVREVGEDEGIRMMVDVVEEGWVEVQDEILAEGSGEMEGEEEGEKEGEKDKEEEGRWGMEGSASPVY